MVRYVAVSPSRDLAVFTHPSGIETPPLVPVGRPSKPNRSTVPTPQPEALFDSRYGSRKYDEFATASIHHRRSVVNKCKIFWTQTPIYALAYNRNVGADKSACRIAMLRKWQRAANASTFISR